MVQQKNAMIVDSIQTTTTMLIIIIMCRFMANVGAIVAGGKAAGIYATNQTEACQYIVEHSEAEVVVVEDESQLNKFLPIRKELKNVKAYVIYNGSKVPDGVNKDKKLAKVYDWAGFLELGKDVKQKDVDVCVCVCVCCLMRFNSSHVSLHNRRTRSLVNRLALKIKSRAIAPH
jgi:long-subunit acyl-CoA synthetase (AMP-forming)